MTDDILFVEDVAELLRVPISTLHTWRNLNRGPVSFKIGTRIRYRRSAVEAFVASQEAATARGGAA